MTPDQEYKLLTKETSALGEMLIDESALRFGREHLRFYRWALLQHSELWEVISSIHFCLSVRKDGKDTMVLLKALLSQYGLWNTVIFPQDLDYHLRIAYPGAVADLLMIESEIRSEGQYDA